MEAPPPPELAQYIDVGFNSITSNLQAIISPEKFPTTSTMPPYSMVFVSRGNQSAAFNGHFPQIVGLASNRVSEAGAIRLVGFSKACSERISLCLNIARASSIAVRRDAPGAQALQNLVSQTVPEIEIPWHKEAKAVEYRKTKINSTEATVGAKRVKKG